LPAPPGCGIGKQAKRVRTGEHIRKKDKQVKRLQKRDRQHRRVNADLRARATAASGAVSSGRGRSGPGGGNLTWHRPRR
jgi:hypothetical protein